MESSSAMLSLVNSTTLPNMVILDTGPGECHHPEGMVLRQWNLFCIDGLCCNPPLSLNYEPEP